MGRRHAAWLSMAACLATACVGVQAAPDDEPGLAGSPPAWHATARARPQSGMELTPEGELSPLKRLARGTLWRTQIDENSSLSLRLRGGKVGLVLAVRFSSGMKSRDAGSNASNAVTCAPAAPACAARTGRRSFTQGASSPSSTMLRQPISPTTKPDTKSSSAYAWCAAFIGPARKTQRYAASVPTRCVIAGEAAPMPR